MRPHHLRKHGRGPPFAWILTRGIHRRVVVALVAAAGIGAVGGGVAFGAMRGHGPGAIVVVFVATMCALWALGWIATFRIARPLRELADVAGDLHQGHLGSRSRLPQGDGELREVSDALHGMAERVARQLKDQRALMAAVSHELRSPLGRARVLVEMAREGTAPATAYDDLQAEIDAMDDLVGDLLAAARIDFEAVSPQDLDALDVARRAIEIARMPPETLQDTRSPGAVRADPTLLARALSGLLDNARRYGGSVIALQVRQNEDRVRFTVEDDGPGFAPGDEERAFEPFWRAPGTTAPRGEGLGLALVRQIAQAHGGAAGAARRAEGGARVWIEVPAASRVPT